jgi:hypothetical protein
MEPIIIFAHKERMFGLARRPAASCPCNAGSGLNHWDICREASETTIDTEHPIGHFACNRATSVDDLVDLAKVELDAIAVDRGKAN